MIEHVYIAAFITVLGNPGDSIACKQMRGEEIIASAVVILPAGYKSTSVQFYIPTGIDSRTLHYSCGKVQP